MKKLKLDFQHLGNAEILTRSQLKNIMGGSGGSGDDGDGAAFCHLGTSCQLYIRELQQTYTGKCYYQIFGKCFCGVEVGGQTYTTDPNTTSMCYR
ncbi:MAG: hypothetical protein ABIW47_10985 [Ginsengibacter sp.]